MRFPRGLFTENTENTENTEGAHYTVRCGKPQIACHGMSAAFSVFSVFSVFTV